MLGKKPVEYAEMTSKLLTNIFLRSLFIHSSLNYPRMQNLGFCFSLTPVLKQLALTPPREAVFLKRHLQLFNTHPYLSGAIIGSVVREELRAEGREGEAVTRLKNTFMAPYAAMGDPLFSGALKPFCSTVTVLLALMGFLFAPVVYLLLFNPFHLWIRVKSFLEGYREGNGAFKYISTLNLPRLTGIVRWMSLAAAGVLAAFILFFFGEEMKAGFPENATLSMAGLVFILLSYALIKAGIPQTVILYSCASLILLGSWFLC
jgi:mannose PTS system EIID component